MEISGKRVLVLGATGLVGRNVVARLVSEEPKSITAVALPGSISPQNTGPLSSQLIEWVWVDLFSDILETTYTTTKLFQTILSHQPDIVIDCVNSATAFAYKRINAKDKDGDDLRILTRHARCLFEALCAANTKVYLKVGTTGSGGMGYDMPFTHGEESPSDELLRKVAFAGAQTMLLFFQSRAKKGPLIKEVKPAATIAGNVTIDNLANSKGTLQVQDCDPSQPYIITDGWDLASHRGVRFPQGSLVVATIDNGESGRYGLEEFRLLADQHQMQFVMVNEVVDQIMAELKEGSGKNILMSIANALIEGSYNSGRNFEEIERQVHTFENQSDVPSTAFGELGPSRVTKLITEIDILSRIYGNPFKIIEMTTETISKDAEEFIKSNVEYRRMLITTGMPILLSNGCSMLVGDHTRVQFAPDSQLSLEENIDIQANQGWIDFRTTHWAWWQLKLKDLNQQKSQNPNRWPGQIVSSILLS